MLADLEVFVAVAEAEGFTAAARRLGVSKAMVSTAVARLETRLGARLFQRTTRQLSLTEAGAAALPHAQRALVAARDAEEAATEGLTTPRGVLRVTAPMSFGLLHVVPALGAFAGTYPEVALDLVLDDRVLDLAEGGFDLALRIGTLADSSLIGHRLGRSRNVLVAHATYLAQAGLPAVPAELAGHATLVYSLSSSPTRWTFTQDARTETVRVSRPRLQANSSLALHRALHQGLGIARIPAFVVGEDLVAGRLVEVLPGWELPEQGLFALTTRQPLPRKTRAFIDFFRGRIGQPPYWEEGRPAPP